MHDGPYIGKMSARDPSITLDKIPIIRIFVPYASGALSGQQWGSILKTEFLLIPIIATWLLLLLLVIRDRMDHPKGHLGFGILGFLLLLELGFLTGGITRREAPDYPVGKQVLLRGRISGVPEVKQDRWQDQDGNPRSKVKIVAEHVEFRPVFTKGDDSEGEETSEAEAENDEVILETV